MITIRCQTARIKFIDKVTAIFYNEGNLETAGGKKCLRAFEILL